MSLRAACFPCAIFLLSYSQIRVFDAPRPISSDICSLWPPGNKCRFAPLVSLARFFCYPTRKSASSTLHVRFHRTFARYGRRETNVTSRRLFPLRGLHTLYRYNRINTILFSGHSSLIITETPQKPYCSNRLLWGSGEVSSPPALEGRPTAGLREVLRRLPPSALKTTAQTRACQRLPSA